MHKQRSHWSLLLMRGPDQSVKQFNVSKRTVFAAPVVLMTIFSSIVVGLQAKAHSELHRIEQEQETLQLRYSTMIHEHSEELTKKEETINNLANQLTALQQEQHAVSSKLQELKELEAQLQLFIKTYGADVPMQLNRELTTDPELPYKGKASPESASSINQFDKQIAFMAYKAEAPLTQITESMDSLMKSMELTLTRAEHIRGQIDSYPNFWPTERRSITSGYGYRTDPFSGRIRFHAGIDIAGKKGDGVFSAADGVITESGYDSSYGKYVVVEHSNELRTMYMHLDSIDARQGDEVVKGEKLGTMGNSGRSTGTHLHFQIIQSESPVSPLPYLRNEKLLKEEQHV